MESKVCMNGLCGASSSVEWKRGWPLRSGQFAILCDKCGVVYEQLVFCDVFHSNDTGWRECTSCGKRLHCGCIASSSCLELLDSGGIHCISCTKSSPLQANASHEKPEEFSLQTARSIDDSCSTLFNNQSNCRNVEKLNPKHLRDSAGDNCQKLLLASINNDTTGLFFQMKQEEVLPPQGEAESMHSLNFIQSPAALSMNLKSNLHEPSIVVKDAHESLVQTNLTISLAAPSGISNPFPGAAAEEMELNKPFSFLQHGSKSRHLLPKPPKPTLTPGLETNSSTLSQIRVARPPVEGRVKNQLLPRYWPRITDQELQQISGDSNSAITPLFEKVLSASDAGRIGRLVLPKACAEAYFPPISQPEGLPLKIQDVKGKEWVFQFRFWPNNNSRMYVLEGVTPCIQSMQLQAGDTVTFSRLDPGGKLLMGYRKASNTVHVQSLQGSTDPYPNALSKHLSSAGGDLGYISEKYGGKIRDGFLGPSIPVSERKRSRNIGSKSKRLLIDSQDALELKLTWEEIQDMLRPPPCVKPSTTTIEEHEFEEYGEPPVFGKRSIFTICLSGEQEQWTQCDCCLKWRRLPADFLLPPKWSCQENIWDRNRCLCSSPDELNPRVIENLLKLNQDLKRRRIAAIHRPMHEHEPAYLHSLANIVARGDNTSDQGATPVATTTKHPRHRPGCSCIVCIQPPSGKGKHKPTCTCNVCMTVKRRFKTLMMRKKKRQSDREAEIAQRNQFMWGPKEEVEVDSISQQISSHLDPEEHEARLGNEAQLKDQSSNQSQKFSETEKGHLDLNCHPDREELNMGSSHVSMTSLLQVASLPLETYLKQNGLTSLIPEQQTSSGSQVLPEANGQSEVQLHDDHSHTPQGQEEEKRANEDFSEPDHSNDTQ